MDRDTSPRDAASTRHPAAVDTQDVPQKVLSLQERTLVLEGYIAGQERHLEERREVIEHLDEAVRERETRIAELQRVCDERLAVIHLLDQAANGRADVNGQREQIGQLTQIEQLTQTTRELEARTAELQRVCDERLAVIHEL